MPTPIYQVDAFASEPFRGNPAGVCFPSGKPDARWMQAVAAEMNVSETAFLQPREDGYDLRWFSPTVEVDLCGHATLAGAHILWETSRLAPDQTARFHTRSGLLTARRLTDAVEMDFPAELAHPVAAPPDLARALGVPLRYVGRNRLDYLVEIDSEQALRQLRPDLHLLAAIPTRGFIVTAPSATAQYDFVSRFFAPSAGMDEDPVTGSAHCCLGPYWAVKLGKTRFVAYQASARGGVIGVALDGARVLLSGQAVTVLTGELRL